MAKTDKFRDILDNVLKNLGRFVGKLKRMDRRFLIMAGVAIVLVIVMLALIIHGVKSNKEDEEGSTAADSSNITEWTTEDEPDDTVMLNGAGKYRIDTGSTSSLNMRLAADKNSAVVTTIPNGTEIEVMFVDDSAVETPDDFGWGYVEYNGKRGWVFMEYLVK